MLVTSPPPMVSISDVLTSAGPRPAPPQRSKGELSHSCDSSPLSLPAPAPKARLYVDFTAPKVCKVDVKPAPTPTPANAPATRAGRAPGGPVGRSVAAAVGAGLDLGLRGVAHRDLCAAARAPRQPLQRNGVRRVAATSNSTAANLQFTATPRLGRLQVASW